MELEIAHLDLRYEALRVRSPCRERRLVASLSECGQLAPIVVARADDGSGATVVIDGYRRIWGLRRLHRDTVLAVEWELSEIDALLLRRALSVGSGETSLEQAWLLEELRERFHLSLEELAQRFDRSPSWVSRRLALVAELPAGVQQLIRDGKIVPHAAAKHLVPLARANPDDCERLALNIAPHRLSSREIGELYAAWRDANSASARSNIVAEPQMYLRARSELTRPEGGLGPRTGLLNDLVALAAISRRAVRRLRDGALLLPLSDLEQKEMSGAYSTARAALDRLWEALQGVMGKEDARSRNESGDPEAPQARDVDPENSKVAQDLAECR